VKLGGKESEYLPFSLVYHGLNDRRIQASGRHAPSINNDSWNLLFGVSSLLFLLFVLAAFCRKSCLRLCFVRHPAFWSSPTMWRLGASRAAPNEQPQH
jgi:hypothetical protein